MSMKENKQTGTESGTKDDNKLYLHQLIYKLRNNLYSGSLLHLLFNKCFTTGS